MTQPLGDLHDGILVQPAGSAAGLCALAVASRLASMAFKPGGGTRVWVRVRFVQMTPPVTQKIHGQINTRGGKRGLRIRDGTLLHGELKPIRRQIQPGLLPGSRLVGRDKLMRPGDRRDDRLQPLFIGGPRPKPVPSRNRLQPQPRRSGDQVRQLVRLGRRFLPGPGSR